jgi:hypothetical protein
MIQDCLAISWHGRRLVYWIVALLVSWTAAVFPLAGPSQV